MKKPIFFLFIFLVFSCSSFSQYFDSVIYVGNHFATYVQFNGSKVLGADIGNTDGISFDTLPVSKNIMRLQAKKEFLETNVLFVLKDTLINCRLKYASVSPKPIYSFNIYTNQQKLLDSTEAWLIQSEFQKRRKINKINAFEQNLSVSNQESEVHFEVTNLLVDSSYLYVKLQVENNSGFDYKIDRVQFQTVNKKNVVKSSAISKINPPITDEFDNPLSVPPYSKRKFIYAFNEFTPNEKEFVLISFVEAQSNSLGRNITLKLSQKQFQKAITIE